MLGFLKGGAILWKTNNQKPCYTVPLNLYIKLKNPMLPYFCRSRQLRWWLGKLSVVSKFGKSCRLLLELVGTLHEHPDGELLQGAGGGIGHKWSLCNSYRYVTTCGINFSGYHNCRKWTSCNSFLTTSGTILM